jgi:hypothetical protein
MANSFDPKSKVWVIDTAAATTVDANDLRVSGIRWVVDSGGAAGNVAEIQDPGTNAVVYHDVNTNGTTYSSADNAKRRWPIGFKVPTLGAGKLYIQLE